MSLNNVFKDFEKKTKKAVKYNDALLYRIKLISFYKDCSYSIQIAGRTLECNTHYEYFPSFTSKQEDTFYAFCVELVEFVLEYNVFDIIEISIEEIANCYEIFVAGLLVPSLNGAFKRTQVLHFSIERLQ